MPDFAKLFRALGQCLGRVEQWRAFLVFVYALFVAALCWLAFAPRDPLVILAFALLLVFFAAFIAMLGQRDL